MPTAAPKVQADTFSQGGETWVKLRRADYEQLIAYIGRLKAEAARRDPEDGAVSIGAVTFDDLGQGVATARVKRGITQKELAKRLGTKQSGISRIENGNQNVTFEMLQKIASQIGCSVSEFISG